MPEQGEFYFSRHDGGVPESGHPVLVLIHGAGGSSLHWPPQLRRLPGEIIYGLDLPGHGRSKGHPEKSIEGYAQRVIEWLDILELENFILVGHSMGGAISLMIGLEVPQRIGGLVLVGTGAKLRVHPQLLAFTENATSHQQLIEQMTKWAFSDRADERLVRLAQKRMDEVAAEVFHADFLACDQFDVMGRLSEITTPILIICGSEDKMTPVKYSQYLADHIHQARLYVVEGAGHMVMLEKPEEVVGQIQAFMKDCIGS